ncbi:MAG: SigE family RNA polymerase sigma factor [Cellulosimicrobium cellulans]
MTATGTAGSVGGTGGLELLLDVAGDDHRDEHRDDGQDGAATVEVDLVARRTRDQEFSAFMRDARDPLHRMAYLLCGDRHRAEELTQHALERTYRAWSRARERDPLAYARRVLANLRVDTWRRTRREVLAGPDELTQAEGAGRQGRPGTGEPTASVDDRDAVVRALLTLPVKQRRVVVMRHLLDLSESEVAAELGMPVGTVKSTASRGLARLRALLGAPEGTAPAPTTTPLTPPTARTSGRTPR